MITIKEIADMMGLSTTTVSNVINGKTGEVSQKTVARVEEVLEKYEYVPNINAKNLAQNQSKIIGVGMKARMDKYANILADPFFGPLLGSIEAETRRLGYFMMFYVSDDINELMSQVTTWNVDGLILSGMMPDDFVKIQKKYKKPVVLIDSYLPREITKYMNIGLEDKKGTYLMTKYLQEKGHRMIAFVTDNLEGVDYFRYQGFKDAMQEIGVEINKEDLVFFDPARDGRQTSLEEIKNLIGTYTVFMCMSDYYAAMIMGYLLDQGIRIPEDISITGYDDNIVGRAMRPGLTTVHQNVDEKGRTAVDALIRLMNGETIHKDIKLPIELVLRESVKDIAEN